MTNERPHSSPEAARKLIELAKSIEAIQDESRSEKPQLFSMHAACFGRCAAFHCGILRGLVPRHRRPSTTSCRIFPFDFVWLLRRRDNPSATVEGGRRGHDGMHRGDGATLLNFKSSLHSGFRFGLNRHKFATAAARGARPQDPSKGPLETTWRLETAATRATGLAEALSKG